MVRPRQHKTKFSRFSELSVEVQIIILDYFLNRICRTDRPPTNGPRRKKDLPKSLAPFACVSRIWQDYFESKTFHNLRLGPADIPEFCSMTLSERRRRFVKHVLLIYSLKCDFNLNTDKMNNLDRGMNNLEFTMAIKKLLQVFSTWKVTDNQNISLEIGLHVPHKTKDWDADKRREEIYSEYLGVISPWFVRYPEFFWHGHRDHWNGYFSFYGTPSNSRDKSKGITEKLLWNHPLRLIPDRITEKLLGNHPLRLIPDSSLKRGDGVFRLPIAEAITKFLIRLEYFPNFSPETLEYIFRSLPRLQEIRVERWRFGSANYDEVWDTQRTAIFSSGAPASLKRLSIFEMGDTPWHKCFKTVPTPEADAMVSNQLLTASYGLEQLSIVSLIDAAQFYRASNDLNPTFKDADPNTQPTWPHLRELALTAKDLKPDSEIKASALILAAARAAKRMPKLQVLELWNHDDGDMAVLRYYRTDDMPHGELFWLDTWGSRIERKCVKAWDEVVSLHSNGRQALFACRNQFRAKAKTSRCILRHLHLEDLIIHEVSRSQVENEWLPFKYLDTNTGLD